MTLSNININQNSASSNYFLLISHSSCDSCARFEAALTHLEDEALLHHEVFLLKCNDEDLYEISQKYTIEDIPTMIYFSSGVEKKRWKGFFEGSVNEVSIKLKNLLDNEVQ